MVTADGKSVKSERGRLIAKAIWLELLIEAEKIEVRMANNNRTIDSPQKA